MCKQICTELIYRRAENICQKNRLHVRNYFRTSQGDQLGSFDDKTQKYKKDLTFVYLKWEKYPVQAAPPAQNLVTVNKKC